MLKPENKKSIILLLILATVLLALLVYRPMLQKLPSLSSEEAELAFQNEDLTRKKEELAGPLPQEVKQARAALDDKLSAMLDMSNNYDYHYELVDLAASFGLRVDSLQIGDPEDMAFDESAFTDSSYLPKLRTVTMVLDGTEDSFLAFADAVGELGENVNIDVSFSPSDYSQPYVLTAKFYTIEGLEVN